MRILEVTLPDSCGVPFDAIDAVIMTLPRFVVATELIDQSVHLRAVGLVDVSQAGSL